MDGMDLDVQLDLDLDLEIGDGLRLRVLAKDDADLLVEATSGESARSLWDAYPVGPYSLIDGKKALAAWDPDEGGQFSVGVMDGNRLLGAVGLMPDGPGSVELAYWVRPEQRGRGIASRAVGATTHWGHTRLAVPRIWLEIRPDNEPSLRLARRLGYRLESRMPRHCRDHVHADPARDTWHDCLIWVHTATGRPPERGAPTARAQHGRPPAAGA
ncbi:GNAT family N-acetyltransferase [Streptomyces sp. TS71-3]|uniref:GNAT family N-acetyltransferase n=1 Tax=Streptomyces sp. TS71-3 TaxID=2733862 RepID=UPI001B20DBE6|nr:GNAT family protein [Streptomyces sp. TS71-3]GHJ37284.1 hypothetical protein Sm713_28930 [Streptomyces sp. TS71-3]